MLSDTRSELRRHSARLLGFTGMLGVLILLSPAPAESQVFDCMNDSVHDVHDWSEDGCARANNPHFIYWDSITTCGQQARCCKACFACCNGTREEHHNCVCSAFWWNPSHRETCEQSANTRRGNCTVGCQGENYTGPGSCYQVSEWHQYDMEALRWCDRCDNKDSCN